MPLKQKPPKFDTELNIPVPVYIVRNGILRYFNPGFKNLTGYSEEELIGSNYMDLIFQDDKLLVENSSKRVIDENTPVNTDYRLVNKKGEIHWVTDTLTSILYKKEKAFLGMILDITDRKKVEATLIKTNNRYKTIFNNSCEPIYIFNLNYSFLEVNDAACFLFGYTREEMKNKSIRDLASPEFAKNFDRGIKELLDIGEVVVEAEGIHKTGRTIPIETHSRVIDYDDKKAILVVARDLTDRKLLDQIRKNNENRLVSFAKIAQSNFSNSRELLDFSLEELIKLTQSQMGYIYSYNESIKEFDLISLSKNLRKNIYYINNPVKLKLDKTEILAEIIKQHKQIIINYSQVPDLYKNGFPMADFCLSKFISVPILRGDRVVAVIGVANRDKDYDPTDVVQITMLMDSVWNLVERKQLTEEITTEKNKLQSITDSIEFGLNIVNPDYKIIYQNAYSTSDIGSHPDEKCYRVFAHGDNICDQCPVKLAFTDGKSHTIEREDIGRDGKTHIYEFTANCIRNANNKITSCVEFIRDITKKRQEEIKLIESEEFNANLLNSSPNPIIVVNPDLSIKYINPSFIELTGFSEQEIIGAKPPYPWFPRDKIEEYTASLKNVLSHGIKRWERNYITKDGKNLWIKVSSTVVEYKGQTSNIIAIWDDITKNKLMEESLRLSEANFRNLIENAPVGVSVNLLNGKTLNANKTFRDLLGLNSEKDLGETSFDDLFQISEDKDKFLNRVKEGKLTGFEAIIKRKDHNQFWASISAINQKYNNDDCIITFIEDISPRRKAKEDLEKVNQQLIEIDKLKDNFLSTVSHELRTPLTSIKSFAEILLNYDEDKATQKEFLGIINEESDRLSRLINDFLDLSKIQAGRMQWNTGNVDILEMVRVSVNTLKPLIEKNKLDLKIDLPDDLPQVLSDKDKLIQVFTNLLGNSIKFTPEGGKITLQAELTESNAGSGIQNVVEVKITDTGIGIAPENFQKIFEKFGQVGDVLKDRPKGTGLGLPICKKIIEYYGGNIWVESVLGKGSTFYFTLPVAKNQIVKEIPLHSNVNVSLSKDVKPNMNKTILVVDDEVNIRRFIKYELNKRGYTVLEASNGTEAVNMSRQYLPQLIALDIMMPGINGFDVTAVLKNDPLTERIPILIISVIEDKQKALGLGANDYITKPISIEMLLQRVNHLIKENKTKILVVDDDSSIVRSLKFELKNRGYNVNVAVNGGEALHSVQKDPPSLIILDILMPDLDGYQVLKTIRNNSETSSTPVILLTGLEIDGGRVKALAIGANEYINKSEGFNKLFEAIERILGENPRSLNQ